MPCAVGLPFLLGGPCGGLGDPDGDGAFCPTWLACAFWPPSPSLCAALGGGVAYSVTVNVLPPSLIKRLNCWLNSYYGTYCVYNFFGKRQAFFNPADMRRHL